MAGYTRQSIADIVNGLDITAPPLTAEFNQIDAAFHATTGHAHDGSSGNAPKINLATSVQGYLPAAHGGVGGLNKTDATVAPAATNDNLQGYVPGSIWINTTNGRTYRCVGNATNAAVWREEVHVLSGNQITPVATATVDLGTSAVRFKDAYVGSVNTTGAATVGGNLSVTGTTTLTGATSVGSITASTGFSGPLTGNVTGDVSGTLTGNVIATTGTSSFNNVTVNGSLDLNSSTSATVTGLSAPVNATDAATKAYVDGAVDELVIQTLATNEAATVTYVNNADALKLNLTGGTMTGAIAMSSNKITGLGTPAFNDDATPKTYVDTADALRLSLSGGTMSGAIAMGTNKITGLGTPTNNDDAASKTYVDTADALKLNLAGGTMTGAISMGGSRINNLGTPTQAADAATKSYTDAILPSFTGNAGKSLRVNSAADAVEWSFPAQTNYQEFTASGTWAKPANCTMVYIECVGGGGGGSSSTGATITVGGGGGGGFAARAMLASDLNANVTVTVGAGGGSSANGGASSFGAHVSAYGGRGGRGSAFVFNTGSNSDSLLTSSTDQIVDTQRAMSPNGSGGGYGASGVTPGGNAVFGGGGGSGGGGGAVGVSQRHGNGGMGNNSLNVSGGNGVAPGGGGGGSGNNVSAGNGGNGARGEVKIWAW